MRQKLILAYGVASYLIFLGVFLYAIGFIGNFGVPTTLDGQPEVPLATALITNVILMSAFALQHSGMARPRFKKWLTRYVPASAERSTYVLCTNVAMILMFWLWQPMGGVLWNIENSVGQVVLYSIYAVGWAIVFVSTLLINHFDLFGLRQVWLQYIGKPYTQLPFKTPGPYQYIRHPLYIGWLTVVWATPTMTAAHFLFAFITTTYILVAIRFEEADLVDGLPGYAEYRQRVPMLIPALRSAARPEPHTPVESLSSSGAGAQG